MAGRRNPLEPGIAPELQQADQGRRPIRFSLCATLKAITAAIGWQAHSVRGFISGHLIKKMKLRVKSFRLDGERVYAIKS
jgi:hypothetical protein